ncbi:MAG: glycoside hydrolase family 15 protein [Acidimicrobiales bacterium]
MAEETPLAAHRLLGDGGSAALVTDDGVVDWWCAPRFDSPPLLWSLLDPAGAASRWVGASFVAVDGRPAGPTATTVVRTEGRRVRLRDGLVAVDGGTCLVRAARVEDGPPLVLVHELALGGFDAAWATPPTFESTSTHGSITVLADGTSTTTDERWWRATMTATTDGWTGVVIGVDAGVPWATVDAAVDALDDVAAAAVGELRRARLPRHHPERAADALAVLAACTDRTTGATVAAPTTSLPEVPGADRQFDYRYCWLRDAALATSVASLLGRRDIARRYLDFIAAAALPDPNRCPPLLDVRGGAVPPERTIEGVRGWGASAPVRVGNAAADQVQYDAWGFVLEAVSVHLQTGGSLDDRTWQLVCAIAERTAAADFEPTNGIWELREPRLLISADIGRWLVLDRAIWIARAWRPFHRRRHWKRARQVALDRVLGAVEPHGGLPQGHDDPRPDAAALMAVVFGLLDPSDPRAARLVDATLRDLAVGPHLRRYPPGDDGFDGVEGAFVPVGWWAVCALAMIGRQPQAEALADELCATLPALLSEEVDPSSGAGLGNTPLVWSHMELARAMYVLDAARIRDRWGTLALWTWRLARYARLRWRHRPRTDPAPQ